VVVPSLQRSVLVTNAYNQTIHKNKKVSNTIRDLEDSSSSFSSSQIYVITKDFNQPNLDPNHMRKKERKKESSSPFEDGAVFLFLLCGDTRARLHPLLTLCA
jgi:hypothetical protein